MRRRWCWAHSITQWLQCNRATTERLWVVDWAQKSIRFLLDLCMKLCLCSDRVSTKRWWPMATRCSATEERREDRICLPPEARSLTAQVGSEKKVFCVFCLSFERKRSVLLLQHSAQQSIRLFPFSFLFSHFVLLADLSANHVGVAAILLAQRRRFGRHLRARQLVVLSQSHWKAKEEKSLFFCFFKKEIVNTAAACCCGSLGPTCSHRSTCPFSRFFFLFLFFSLIFIQNQSPLWLHLRYLDPYHWYRSPNTTFEFVSEADGPIVIPVDIRFFSRLFRGDLCSLFLLFLSMCSLFP